MPKPPRFSVVKRVGSRRTLDRILVNRSDARIRCPTCLERLELKDYVHSHAVQRHGWDPERVCIYCSGGKSWPARKPDFKHVVPCLRSLLSAIREPRAIEGPPRSIEGPPRSIEGPSAMEEEGGETSSIQEGGGETSSIQEPSAMEEEDPPPPPPPPVSRAPCRECSTFVSRPRQLWGRDRREDVSVHLYESVYERPEAYGESAIAFTRESGLGSDVYAIVQRYLAGGGLTWYHLMVVDKKFDHFVASFEGMRNRMFLLPHWCLCDGLTRNRKTHRHMIAAVESEAEFRSVWVNGMRYALDEGGCSKKSIRIKNAFHLIRTIQYVSQCKASCDGKRIRDAVVEPEDGGRPRTSHFYINRPLHEHAIACMSTMFGGGLQKLVEEQNKNKEVVGWLKHAKKIRDVYRNLRYAVPIGVTGFKFLNCVLPLSREFEPSDRETPLFLHWIEDEKLYLKRDPTNSRDASSQEEWLARQVERGNTLTSVSEVLYVLCRRQQKVMKQIAMAMAEKEETDARSREEAFRKNDARMTVLESEMASVKQKMTAFEAENARLNEKIQTASRVVAKFSRVQNENSLELANYVLTTMSFMEELKRILS